jgi:tetratricopeptide (TPR) repeat protein
MKLTFRYFKLFTLIAWIFLNGSFANGTNLDEDMRDMPFGEYLAARQASYNNDLEASADFYLQVIKLDPDNIELYQRAYTVAVADGRFEEAISIAHYLKEHDQASEISDLLLFFEMVKKKNYQSALAEIEELSDDGMFKLMKPLFRAWIYADLGQKKEVDKIDFNFDQSEAFKFFKYYHAGLIYDFLGETEKAAQYYSQALSDRNVLNYRAAEAYGNNLRAQNKNDLAIEIYNTYIERSPGNDHLQKALVDAENVIPQKLIVTRIEEGFAEMFYSAATILMQDKVTQPATFYLRNALYLRGDFPLANYMLAQVFEEDEYFKGAIKALNKISDESPLYFHSQLQKAWLLDKLDQDDDALKAMIKLTKDYPNNREALNALAEYYRMNNKFEDAVIGYDKIILTIDQEKEQDWILYYTRGIVLDQVKRWSDAEASFKKALELKPEQPMVMNYLAYSWVDKGLNLVEARTMLERAVELRPNDGYIVDSLGWALYKMGNQEEAVSILERAAQLQTSDWAINDHLGDAYWTVGRKNEARFQWRHALSLSPDEEKIIHIKTKIKNGHN